MPSARFFGEGVHCVLRLQESQSAGRAVNRIGCRKLAFVEFVKQVSRADDIDRNA